MVNSVPWDSYFSHTQTPKDKMEKRSMGLVLFPYTKLQTTKWKRGRKRCVILHIRHPHFLGRRFHSSEILELGSKSEVDSIAANSSHVLT